MLYYTLCPTCTTSLCIRHRRSKVSIGAIAAAVLNFHSYWLEQFWLLCQYQISFQSRKKNNNPVFRTTKTNRFTEAVHVLFEKRERDEQKKVWISHYECELFPLPFRTSAFIFLCEVICFHLFQNRKWYEKHLHRFSCSLGRACMRMCLSEKCEWKIKRKV